MKFRIDFVTNSSSSSFILAKKEKLTEKQREEIINFIEETMFGEKIATNKEELDRYFKKNHGEDYSNFQIGMENETPYERYCWVNRYKKALKALENGLIIYSGWVSFEDGDEYADILSMLWEKMEEVDNKSFISIDTKLEY